MTIYLDVVLIENLCMNYIILFATGYILKLKISNIKVVISSLIGSVYAIVCYMEILEIYSNIITKIVLSIVMVYVAFRPRNVKMCIKQVLMFYLISFIFGGCAFALLYIVKPQDIITRNGVFVGTYPIKIAVLGALVGFIITYLVFKLIKNGFSNKNVFCDIYVKFKEREILVKGMLDTGNLLKDPITQMPVILIEKDKLYDILPKSILDNIEKIIGGDKLENISEQEKNEYLPKFKIIPFNSVGKQNGILIGFKVDRINIIENDEEKESTDIIVGIFNGKFDKHDRYSALFGLEALERREKNEYITNIKI